MLTRNEYQIKLDDSNQTQNFSYLCICVETKSRQSDDEYYKRRRVRAELMNHYRQTPHSAVSIQNI